MNNCKHILHYIFKKHQLYSNDVFISNNNYLDFMPEKMDNRVVYYCSNEWVHPVMAGIFVGSHPESCPELVSGSFQDFS